MEVSKGASDREIRTKRGQNSSTLSGGVSGGDNQVGRRDLLTLDCYEGHGNVEKLLRTNKALRECETRAAAIKGGQRTSTRPGIVMRLSENFSKRSTLEHCVRGHYLTSDAEK